MLNPSVRHQARELMHSIGLLTRCLQIPKTTDTQRAAWERGILQARRDLEGLYAAGLMRNFLTEATRPEALGIRPTFAEEKAILRRAARRAVAAARANQRPL